MPPQMQDSDNISVFREPAAATSSWICPKEKQSMKEFVKVDKIMKTAGLNVPEIFEVDFEGGFMLLSDLGTKTYLDVLESR